MNGIALRLTTTAVLLLVTLPLSATICTTRDFNSFVLGGVAQPEPFALTGRVNNICAPRENTVLLEDATGVSHIFNIRTGNANVGDIVSIQGFVRVNPPDREPWIEGATLAIIGRTNAPSPIAVSLEEIGRGDCNYRPVETTGVVADVFEDDVDAKSGFLVLKDGVHTIPVVRQRDDLDNCRRLLDAKVKVVGIYYPYVYGYRRFQGPYIDACFLPISVLEPAPQPFSVPPLELLSYKKPADLLKIDRRRITGRVRAAWQGDRLLLDADDGRKIFATLTTMQTLPSYGERITLSGYPDTDVFNLTLTRAVFRPEQALDKGTQTTTDIVPSDLIAESNGSPTFNIKLHTERIRLRGTARALASARGGGRRLTLEHDGRIIPVEINARLCDGLDIPIGSRLEVSGIFLVNCENWSPTRILPRIDDVFIVPQLAQDIKILSTPSWWTPQRLTVVIVSLLAALVGIYIWNRVLTRLVSRKSAELFKSEIAQASAELRIDERTRLAVELHDSLSQNLTGVYCQVAATKRALSVDPGSVARHLETVERMLESGRNELRRCLWDLRGAALEEQDFATAIRMSIEPLMSEADISLRFFIPRKRLSDTTAHMTICIIRELVTNAIRHGKARHIRIAGEIHADEMSFSVRDDGCGFDPANCAGPSEGHFGLTGIRERVNRLNGRVAFESSPGKGSRIVVSIRLPHPDQSDLQSEA